MRVRFISALIASLAACALLPATSTAAPASQGCDGSHHSDTGHGANQRGPYDNTCDGSASGNGNGNGQATGKPCAGCVGNADDKNPGWGNGKGQMPNGSDHNAGYECDRNHGIGRTNPAHTGCRATTTVNPPPQTCPNGSPMPPSGKCDQGNNNGGGNKCPDGSAPVNGNCGSQPPPQNTETPPTTPPGQQAVLGERQSGNAPATTPAATTPPNDQQEVLGERAAGNEDESPSESTPPASAQEAQPVSTNKSLPFTGTDVFALLLAGGLALTAGLGLRRLAAHRPQ